MPSEAKCSRCGMPPEVKNDDGDIVVACCCTELSVEKEYSDLEWGDPVAV